MKAGLNPQQWALSSTFVQMSGFVSSVRVTAKNVVKPHEHVTFKLSVYQ